MFDWFKRPKFVEQTTATDDMMLGDHESSALPLSNVMPFMPKVVAPRDTTNDDAMYTIGRNDAGRIQLRMNGGGYGYSSLTLTMNESAVRSLIRQLEAALPEEEEEEDDLS